MVETRSRQQKSCVDAPRRTLETLRVDALVAVCVRVPYASHDAVRCSCRRLRSACERTAIAKHRRGTGWHECALVVAGGGNTVYEHSDDDAEPDRPETWALVGATWRAMAPQPVPRCDCGVASYGGEMVCVGGTTTTWDEFTSMDDAEGGWTMTTGIADVVAYDAAADAWRSYGPADQARGAALAARTSARCAIDQSSGALLVFGGWRVVDRRALTDAAVTAAQALRAADPATDPGLAPDSSWRGLPEPPYAVSNFALAVLGGKFHVAGGLRWNADGSRRMPTDALQIYDPVSNAWRIGPELPNPQYYGDGAAFKGKMYVVAGKNASRRLSTAVAVYDPEVDAWAPGPRLPEPRFYHSVLVHRGRLVCFGGGGGEERSDPLVLSEDGTSWLHDPAVIPPLPPGFDHPVLAPMVCSVPVG